MERVLPIVIPDQVSPPRGRKQAVTKSPSFLTTTFAGHTMFGGNTAEIISNGMRSNGTCTIQFRSIFFLISQFYCFDGGLYYPLPAVIQSGTREACVFSKNPCIHRSSPHGVIGVLTYQIGDSPRRVAVIFSVPYNQLQYRNHFGTAIVTGFRLGELGPFHTLGGRRGERGHAPLRQDVSGRRLLPQGRSCPQFGE
ncbi:Actinoporin Or-A [Folsomia candida]|uniref:Actinoporin Or-A n=1 Tax=Folsomia candida TaxID=158441 RepID=A0A226E2H5_FOLCA|nr:Actinoporin Or-A [Folsomia candida]